MLWQLIAAAVLLLFYGTYYGKLIKQRRKGIQTDQIAKGKQKGKRYYTEAVLKAATFGVAFVQIVSILFHLSVSGITARVAGLVISAAGIIIFIAAVVTMRDSWRAGIAESDSTALVTSGIYSISRNPAFLAFDLFYLGVLMMLFNPLLLIFTVFACIMLHLQILQEEEYLPQAFGKSYIEYRSSVRRYLGRKSDRNNHL